MDTKLQISILATLAGKDRIISENGALPWKISEDEKHFSDLIRNRTVIVGRKSYESEARDLSGARNRIVLTNNISFFREGAIPAYSFEDALQKAGGLGAKEVFVVGGSELFNHFLSEAHTLYLTVLDKETSGDMSFPECSGFKISSEEEKQVGRLTITFTELERI